MTATHNTTQLRQAIETHGRAYKLLRWVEGAVDRGFISFSHAREYATKEFVAAEWIAQHYENIPPSARPESSDEASVKRLARYFSTYLTTSFELVEIPGKETRSCCGCFCEMCTYLANASHLKMRKLSKSHKRQAESLKLHHTETLLGSVGYADVDPEELLKDKESSRNAALVAYGAELLRRCEGQSYGPAVMALWRQFAWKPEGNPDPKFRLSVELIDQARSNLLAEAARRRQAK